MTLRVVVPPRLATSKVIGLPGLFGLLAGMKKEGVRVLIPTVT